MLDGLYLITDGPSGGHSLAAHRSVLRGGVKVLQYRNKELTPEQQVEDAAPLRELCRESGVLFLVNDHPEVARALDADGVHLGQGDLPVAEARRLLGPGKQIGVTVREPEQALKAEMQGADYLGVGSIFPSPTKTAQLIGLEGLRRVRRAVTIPLVAIGGLTGRNAGAALDAGADGLAAVSAVFDDPRPVLAARELSLLCNRKRPAGESRVLTVAGSDSGGGAGIQADLKTIALLGSFGMSAITALTAQNTLGVEEVHPVPAEFVARQLHAVLEDLGADTVKSGMLFSADIVLALALALERHGLPAVVDPVMVAKGGAPLLQEDAVEAFRTELLPEAYLLTPNLPEAGALLGRPVREETEMEEAARELQALGARNVLLKGGHLAGEAAADLLLVGREARWLRAPRLESTSTHGTGCTFAAALAALLAQGRSLEEAADGAKRFITAAIRLAVPLGRGHGPVNHLLAAREFRGAGDSDEPRPRRGEGSTPARPKGD